jgi:hypothetical protein
MGRTRQSFVLASFGFALALAGCGNPTAPKLSSAGAVAPVASPALAAAPVGGITGVEDLEPPPVVTGVASPLGEPPAAVAEPAQAPDRATPARVVGSLADALKAHDLASLARLELEVGDKPVLDANDLARVERDFFGPREAYWQRVLAGLKPGALDQLDPDARRVVVSSTVGGALGSVDLVFEKGVDGWVLR